VSTRQLISDDGVTRRWRVLNDAGKEIGIDVETIPTPTEANAATLRDRAAQALAVNATYLALANPTAAQTTTQVQRLTRECSALIRLTINQLDSVSDA
jgi:hypothetical protein